MKYRICLVEPNGDSLRILVKLIQDIGMETHLYPDAQKALAEWEAVNPNLVLSEWELPDTDGAEFCSQVAMRAPQVPFIFLTDARDSDIRLKAVRSGALDLFTKPFDREILAAKMQNALRLATASNYHKEPVSKASSRSLEFIEFMNAQNATSVKPSPDVASKIGFSYRLIAVWDSKLNQAEKQVDFLEELTQEGKLKKRVYDVVRTCPGCASLNVNVRLVCPECYLPIVGDNQLDNPSKQADTGALHGCRKCGAHFTTGNSYARCLSCGIEFEEKKANSVVIHTYFLDDDGISRKPSNGNFLLENMLRENDLESLPGSLFQEFLRLEKHQHNLMQKPYAVLHIIFPSFLERKNGKEDLKKTGNILLVLKKVIQSEASFFLNPPNGLIVFLPYTDPQIAKEMEAKIKYYLRSLHLDSLVQINLIVHNSSKVVRSLEKEIKTA